ncbi:HK97 family phage prohead protease [Mesorhizobium sp.]|uniref:HK97 family phage prohead protease n=1 Tax=Mesorhizobium sp. TaxID=1871066 RepID=UPI000FEA8FB9|nr:HK97 family phage prohead protease [Mesorhizobium sp.]RWF66631.1 MAG: HK97 family phage prohead protease [Mesorhizobium sp.]
MTTTKRASARPRSRGRICMIAGYATRFGVAANGQHVIAAGAFTGLLKRGFSPKMLFGHEGDPVGKWVNLTEDEHGLFVVGRVDDRQAIEEVDSGRCQGFSLGRFVGIRKPIEGGISLCVEVLALPEISIVHEPGNPGALIEAFCMGAVNGHH